eukprot:Phypoly_transcript_15499.p1 GENE.Phypoly_transcript_15499~~Phypoly_transcript_15499.p1  ORF type:complete len:186 (+),score=19.32 Phypoly_transcript_15499:365-922(+)
MSGNWNICIAVRKWITHSIQGEFRGFVWKKKLTAISQYFDMVYFVDVKTKKEKYLQLINTFFAKVVNQIPYKDFIIDFSVELNGEVQMIELNPFTKFTSACLFNWNRDIAVLKGKKEFEFRILEAPLEAIREPQIQMDMFSSLAYIDDELKSEFADSLQLTQTFLTDEMERIQSGMKYTLNKRAK